MKAGTVLLESNSKDISRKIAAKNARVISAINAYNKKASQQNISAAERSKALEKIRSNASAVNVIIKYDSLAKYRNVVDIVDEMEDCAVPSGKYAIVKKLEKTEKEKLAEKY